MNERLKELEKLAYVTTTKKVRKGGWDNDREPYEYKTVTETVFSLEKYTELIIKETMQIVAKNVAWNGYLNAAGAVIEHFKDEE